MSTSNLGSTNSQTIQSIIALIRPNQWIKNIFVFTGVIFGKALDSPKILLLALFAAIAFALVSSAVYIFNDLVDCKNDQLHPKKKSRPIASGAITPQAGALLSIIFAFTGLVLGFYLSWQILFILVAYILLNILYSLKLKHIVIIDVFCISCGFMLRILAGTVGIGIAPSKWLLLCGLMITLFLGFTKRRAELIAFDNDKQEQRKVLQDYGAIFLDEIIAICATSVILGYSLYTMSNETIEIHQTDDLLYTVPFVIYAIFRYIYILHHGNSAEDPSNDLFKDRHIIISVLGWMIVSIYILSNKGL
ncbi:MAG: decaprenyl-phosphate phosphoribosyltransferase [Chlamydiota bacterium]|nr:decaprenyl-phosphate phosphoribosyltransferase [Chlamydiota bacterium]